MAGAVAARNDRCRRRKSHGLRCKKGGVRTVQWSGRANVCENGEFLCAARAEKCGNRPFYLPLRARPSKGVTFYCNSFLNPESRALAIVGQSSLTLD